MPDKVLAIQGASTPCSRCGPPEVVLRTVVILLQMHVSLIHPEFCSTVHTSESRCMLDVVSRKRRSVQNLKKAATVITGIDLHLILPWTLCCHVVPPVTDLSALLHVSHNLHG